MWCSLFCPLHLLLICLYITRTSQTDIEDLKNNITSIWKAIEDLQSSLQAYDDKQQILKYEEALDIKMHQDGFTYSLAFISEANTSEALNNSRDVAMGIYHIHKTDTPVDWYFHTATIGMSFWHAGSTLIFHFVHPDGRYEQQRLGDPLKDPKATFVVSLLPEVWHITEVDDTYGSYVLEDTVMIPGYYEEFWRKGEVEDLITRFPQHAQLFNRTG